MCCAHVHQCKIGYEDWVHCLRIRLGMEKPIEEHMQMECPGGRQVNSKTAYVSFIHGDKKATISKPCDPCSKRLLRGYQTSGKIPIVRGVDVDGMPSCIAFVEIDHNAPIFLSKREDNRGHQRGTIVRAYHQHSLMVVITTTTTIVITI